jgi:hypothetical protein
MQKTKEQAANSEKRDFRLHKDILFSIIQKQAGTLSKALLELVMNSIDAGATRVDVSLTENSFSVKDDGKGFVNRQEIEEFFETFGTPHKEGDATFGRFRMGRGQIMAFTRNRWRSGPFRMSVDIRDHGLSYELTTGNTPINGCVIEGELYQELKPSALLSVAREFSESVQYCQVPIYLEDERVSLDLPKEKWTIQDDNAYYKLDPDSRYLSVYNLGVHVRDYAAHQVGGIGGKVISKKQLEVNFARNDVLASECKVWPQILSVLRARAKAAEGKKPTKNSAYRAAQATALLSGDYDSISEMFQAFEDEPVVTDIRGRHYSLCSLFDSANLRFNGKLVMAPSATDRIADKVHQQHLALVLAPSTLSTFGRSSSFSKVLSGISKAVAKHVKRGEDGTQVQNVLNGLAAQLTEFSEVSKGISNKHEAVDPKSLSSEEKRVLKALNRNQYHLLWAMQKGDGTTRLSRDISAGESETALAWTNSDTHIWVNRGELKIKGFHGSTFQGFFRLAALLVHEYCHDSQSLDSHMHDQAFYERYHNVMTLGAESVISFVQAAVNDYVKARLADKAPMRKAEREELDLSKKLQEVEQESSANQPFQDKPVMTA